MLTGLSQRVAYFYPTGVTLLHTSSPSSLRAWLRAVAWAWVCIEVTRAPVAGWGLVRHRARLHQPWGRAQLGQEEHPGPEPCLLGRGAPVVAWQGRRSTKTWLEFTSSKFNLLDLQTFSFALLHIYWDLLFSLQDGVKFVSIGAMFSELVAVSSKGELYQWKWSEPEPYRNAQVENSSQFI